jgi:hypothetical protein
MAGFWAKGKKQSRNEAFCAPILATFFQCPAEASFVISAIMQMPIRLLIALMMCGFVPACANTPPPQTDNFGAPFAANVPNDVRLFIVRRQACDHFRGEPRGDYAERDKFLNAQIDETCTGTDAALTALKTRYQNDMAITKMLSEYEEDIEI